MEERDGIEPVVLVNKMLSEIQTKLEALRAQEEALCEILRHPALTNEGTG